MISLSVGEGGWVDESDPTNNFAGSFLLPLLASKSHENRMGVCAYVPNYPTFVESIILYMERGREGGREV